MKGSRVGPRAERRHQRASHVSRSRTGLTKKKMRSSPPDRTVSLLLVPPVGFLSFTVYSQAQKYLRSDTTFSHFAPARRVTDLKTLKSTFFQTLDSSNFPTEGVMQEFHILSRTVKTAFCFVFYAHILMITLSLLLSH